MKYKFKFLIIFFGLIAVGFFLNKNFNKNLNLVSIANNIIQSCSGEKSRQACYDKKIPLIMDEGVSLENSFEVIKLIQNQDSGYWFCHAVAHSLSSKEYYKNPSKWKEVMTRIPLGICSNGGLHGALQAHFSSESLNGAQIEELMPDIQTICEKRANWEPTNQQQSSCYHELGHLSMYLTNGDVSASGKICEAVSQRDDGRNYLQTCHEGIFMQVFEPREPDDFALVYKLIPEKEKIRVCEKYSDGVEKGGCWKNGWKTSYQNFCGSFEGDLSFACYREAWVIENDNLNKASDVLNYCSYTNETQEKRKCYNKLFYELMSSDNFDTTRVKSICLSLPLDIKSQCFANVASRLIETDKRLKNEAISICKEAESLGVEEGCYKELVYYTSFVFKKGSDEYDEMCHLFPNRWENLCQNKEIKNEKIF